MPDYSAGGVHYLLALISLCLSTNVFLVRAEVLVVSNKMSLQFIHEGGEGGGGGMVLHFSFL